MDGRFGFYYMSIAEIFSEISEGQHQHSFAIVDEESYAGWKRMSGFIDEEIGYMLCRDMVGRHFAIANFVDEGHKWAIMTTKCQHPSPGYGDNWRFIVNIRCDDEEISHSQLSVEDFFKFVEENRRAHDD